MKNRKPYSLKSVLYYYNIFQIVSCSVITYGVSYHLSSLSSHNLDIFSKVLTSGWTTTYSWSCQPVDYSDNPEALSMLNWCYCCYLLKGIELLETVLFILRKKYNQVTKSARLPSLFHLVPCLAGCQIHRRRHGDVSDLRQLHRARFYVHVLSVGQFG
jgi:hypothetical protein